MESSFGRQIRLFGAAGNLAEFGQELGEVVAANWLEKGEQLDAVPARVYLGFERAEGAFAAVESVAGSAAVCGVDESSGLVEMKGLGWFGEGGAGWMACPAIVFGALGF